MTIPRDFAFASLWLVIVAVSVHDGYLVLANRNVMALTEQNPVGRMLIEYNGGDVWLLLGLKAAGTVCAAALLLIMYWTRPAAGWLACSVVAALQLGLLLLLYRA